MVDAVESAYLVYENHSHETEAENRITDATNVLKVTIFGSDIPKPHLQSPRNSFYLQTRTCHRSRETTSESLSEKQLTVILH